MKKLIIFTVVLAVSCAAFGEVWQMTSGTATLDADLSDWDGANWITVDTVYYGAPSNISNAKMAVKWDTNGIYMAVTYDDADLQFAQGAIDWNAQDGMSVYINANNDDANPYDTTGWVTAQDYAMGIMGTNPSGTSSTPQVPNSAWYSLGSVNPLPDPVNWPHAVLDLAVNVSGNSLTYEMKIPALTDITTGDLRTLASGETVGLDMVIADKGASNFGLMSINARAEKYRNAGQFQDWVLVNDPLSVKYTFKETAPGNWEVLADVDGDLTAGLSAYEIWVDGVDAGTVSYDENTLGSATEGFLAANLLQDDIAGSFNAGNCQKVPNVIEGIGKVAINESGVVLDAQALLGVLTTEAGLTEANFRIGEFALLNAAGDGYVYDVENMVIPTIEVIQWLEGDANGDGVVSAGDYASVQANFGSVGIGIAGDANGDGVVSAGDYASVQANFGHTASGAGVIPEPATLSLIVMGGVVLIRRTRKTL